MQEIWFGSKDEEEFKNSNDIVVNSYRQNNFLFNIGEIISKWHGKKKQ